MPINPSGFPNLQELSNGEYNTSTVLNRPLFALSTRTESLRTLLESVESEVVDARDGYGSLDARLDDMFGSAQSDRNIFLAGGSATWSKIAKTFTFSEITLVQPELSYNYTIAAGFKASINDGDSLYVTLSRDSLNTVLPLVKAASGATPSGKDTFVIAVRLGDRLWVRGNGEFENEETREIGDGLTVAALGRLGMVNDRDTASHFTNTTIINVGDNIPTAISKLDLNSEYLIRDRNTLIHGGGESSWAIAAGVGTFTFVDDLIITVPSVGDITITADSVTDIADNELLYISFLRTGSDYTKVLLKSDSASLPLSNGNTDNYVVGYRSGSTFILRNGEVFQDGETKVVGAGGAGLVTYQNMSLYPSSDDDVSWDAASGLVDCAGDVEIHMPWTTFSNIIQSTEFPFLLSTDSKKAYVVLDRESSANVTIIDDVNTIPITYSEPDVLLVAERVGNSVYMFGSHRYNDGDLRRIGEGFVAGEIYDEMYLVTSSGSETTITLPNGGEHASDDKTLKVWVNGKFNYPNVNYTEGPASTQISAKVSEDYPDGKFPAKAHIRLRIESIVTGGAGPGGGGVGDEWSDPVDSNIVPDNDNLRSLGSGVKAFKDIYLSDQIGNGDVYRMYMYSGSLQTIKV